MSVSGDVARDRGGGGGRVGALGALTPGGVRAALPPGGGSVSGAGRARGFYQRGFAEESSEVRTLSQAGHGRVREDVP